VPGWQNPAIAAVSNANHFCDCTKGTVARKGFQVQILGLALLYLFLNGKNNNVFK